MAAGIAVAVLVVGGMTAYASTRSDGTSYRTATVTTQTVQETLESTGTVEPGASATASFPVSGTVATVAVTTGVRVRKGQVLATLDTTSLRSSLAQARSTLANARLTLHQDETGQTSSASGGSGSGGSGSGGSASGGSGSGGSGTGGSGASSGGSTKALVAAQQRLLSSMRSVDAALARTQADLATATSVCGTSSAACAQAQALVLADETKVQTLQGSVAQQEQQLDRLLSASARQSSSSARSSSSRSSSTTTKTVSAAQLAADQAAVDAAVAGVALAQQDLAQATLTSPLSGVVSAVGLTAGSTASAGSSTTAIQVIDPSAHTVTIDVDVTKVPMVKVGQKASVAPDGTGQTLTGTVSYVAAAPASSSSSSYAVRLTLASAPADLHDGIQAGVTLLVAQATGLAVPTSAVGHLGSFTYVLLANGSSTTRQVVTVGAAGAEYTQVTKGLSAGQQVVLANLDEAIPTSTTNNRFARFAGAGGLGGLGGGGGFVVGGGGAAPGRG